jgi:hypothetical protein
MLYAITPNVLQIVRDVIKILPEYPIKTTNIILNAAQMHVIASANVIQFID